MVSINELVSFVQEFRNETNPYVWSELLNNLMNLATLMIEQKHVELVKNLIAELTKPAAQKLGWLERPDESELKCKILNFS